MVRIALEAKLGIDAGNKHYQFASSETDTSRPAIEAAVATAGAASATQEQQTAPRQDTDEGMYL